MMARYAGGRPGSSRRVRLVPVRRSGMDHRAVARIVLALARQMAADEAVEAAADEAAQSSTEQTGSRRSGAMRVASSMSARHCMTERLPHCRHDDAHRSPHEAAAPSSTSGGTP